MMSVSQPDSLSHRVRVIEAHFANDAMSKSLGMEILEIRLTVVRVEMTVRETMVKGHGTCHGGILFALADSASHLLAYAGRPMTAAGANIEFLAPTPLGERLSATATETMRNDRHGIYDVVVRKGNGEPVAHFWGRCARYRPQTIQTAQKGHS